MGTARINIFCTRLFQRFRALNYRSCRIYHIVDHKTILALYVSDNIHNFHNVSLGTTLVNNRHLCVHLCRNFSCARYRSDIGRNNHEIIVDFRFEIIVKRGTADKIVKRNIEETLNLHTVQIHCKNSVRARAGYEVGNELCGYRLSGTGLSVLTRVTEIGNNRGNSARARSLGRVDHYQKFHKVRIYRITCRLNKEYVHSANSLVKANVDLPVGKMSNFHFAESSVKFCRDFFSKRFVGITRKYLYFVSVVNH